MSFPIINMSGSIGVKPIPFRLRVLRSLSACIEQVNPDNGYHFDLRGSVFRGRIRYDQDDPIPMISILEAPIPEEVLASGGDKDMSAGPWQLLIQGFASDDRRNPSDPAHHLMAEVKSVLVQEKAKDHSTNILNMGGRVFEMFIGQGSVRPPDETTEEAFFWLTLTLKLVENLQKPYE